MKKCLLLLVFNLHFIVFFAQSQIATLSHNGEITLFYGAEALKEAHNIAENGDVITLSPGSFNSVDITKLVTIRGAGMGIKVDNNDTYFEPTVIIGDFTISANGNSVYQLTLEGIRHDSYIKLDLINYAKFIKCSFHEVRVSQSNNSSFIHCYVSKSIYTTVTERSFTAINSYFKDVSCSSRGLYTFTNCVLEVATPGNDLKYVSLKNCIIINTGQTSGYTNNSSIFYSLWVGYSDDNPFPNSNEGHNNYVLRSTDDPFEENTFYKLNESIKEFLGSDGKELGIYGGNMPFSPITSIPQIIKFEVAPKTTADGKLSIDIEVKQPE